MDAVTPVPDIPTGAGVQQVPRFLPQEACLDMPEQSLGERRRASEAPPTAPSYLLLRRAALFSGTTAITAAAAYEMHQVLKVSGLTMPEAAVLALFVMLFAWIAFSFASATAGFFSLLFGGSKILGIDPSAPLPKVFTRNALLLPTYNEEPYRVMSRLQAIYESVAATGTLEQFSFFVLSDTTDADTWVLEEAAFLAVRERTNSRQIFYRRRTENRGRKAGNIADWVIRFGGRYDHIVVLDADSLMTGDTIVRLVGAMQHHPQVGLIQTFPVILNGTTLFARLQQFAGRIYGPLIAHGIAWWHGSESNYWGHNAIIRVRAFAEQAGLPVLKGRQPFGGHILSHDFVEAAFMRRGGWAIHMAPSLAGSYEESPPSLTEYAARDRRWCQGNLQHSRVLCARGLHWVSRLHLLTGIGSYVTAPMWLAFLLVGILISLQAQFIRPEYFPSGFSLFPQWPAQDPVRAAWVFAATMGILIAPKLLALILLLARRVERQGCGGGARAVLSVVVETIISGLTAPIMMLIQSRAVIETLAGRDAGWQVQRRDDGTLPASELFRLYGWHTLFGALLAASAYAVSVPLMLWMTPVIAGLLLAVPLAAVSSHQGVGRALKAAGLLTTPEEHRPPAVLARANDLCMSAQRDRKPEAIRLLRADAQLLEAHRQMLPEKRSRRRGEVDVDLLVAQAKLADVSSLNEALDVLTPREKAVALADRSMVDQLVQMPDQPSTPPPQ